MRALLSALLLSLVCSPSLAVDKLSESDLMATGALLATYYVDYRQTMDIKRHPGMYETNLILGKHPSDDKVKHYFLAASILSVGAVYVLPSEYRKVFLGSAITLQLVVIGRNKHIGLHTKF